MTPEAIPHAQDYLGDASTQLFVNQILLSLVIQRGVVTLRARQKH